MGLAGVLVGLQEGLEAGLMSAGFVNALLFSCGYFSVAALIVLGLQWILGLRRTPVKFSETFNALCLGFAPLVIAGILGAIYVGATGGHVGDFTASPLLLFPAQSGSKNIGFILRRIDLFELWAVWQATLALHYRIGGQLKTSYGYAFGFWAVVVIAAAIANGLLS